MSAREELREENDALRAQLIAANEKLSKYRMTLIRISNYEHVSPLASCVCYLGDNGYCCGQIIADKALDEGAKK